MAQDTSPQVTGPIRTTAPSDTYGTHDSRLGIGGYREVATHADRNAITIDRRREGMMVYTADDHTIWILKPGPWVGTDADWESAFDAGDVGVLPLSSGGTGATTAKGARKNLGALTGLVLLVPGNGTDTVFNLDHNMNFAWTFPPAVEEVETGVEVLPNVSVVNNNRVRVEFGDPPAANEFNVYVLGLEA